MNILKMAAFVSALLPLDAFANTIEVTVNDLVPAPSGVEVRFKADAAARVFDPLHSDYARFLAMKDLSQTLGLSWKEEISFDFDTALFTVSASYAPHRIYRTDHPFTAFWESFAAYGRTLAQLVEQDRISLDDIGLEDDLTLPGLKFSSTPPLSGTALGTLGSRFLLCTLPALGQGSIPDHFADAIENGSVCSNLASEQLLATLEVTQFTVDSTPLSAQSDPTVQNLSFFANLCSISIDPDLANPIIKSLQARQWIPENYDEGHGTQDAVRHCKLHVLTKVLPELTEKFADYMRNYKTEVPSPSPFLNQFVEEVSELTPAPYPDAKAYVVDQLYQNLLPSLVDTSVQGIPLFISMRDFNALTLRKALTETAGAWSFKSKLIDALFTEPVGSKSLFFKYLKEVSPERRDAIKSSLGKLYFSRCDSKKPISMECINRSATALQKFQWRGISRESDLIYTGFGSINFSSF